MWSVIVVMIHVFLDYLSMLIVVIILFQAYFSPFERPEKSLNPSLLDIMWNIYCAA
jgi:hypothetical protein